MQKSFQAMLENYFLIKEQRIKEALDAQVLKQEQQENEEEHEDQEEVKSRADSDIDL